MHLNAMNEWQLSPSELEAAKRADEADRREYNESWANATDDEIREQMLIEYELEAKEIENRYQKGHS